MKTLPNFVIKNECQQLKLYFDHTTVPFDHLPMLNVKDIPVEF